jgi:hypothetical protein
MPSPLLSRYSQGENRITASILAVFERISFALVERILQILGEETNLSLLEIKNQIKYGKTDSVPDGAIQASFTYLIETKTELNALRYDQLKKHLDYLGSLSNFKHKKLLVLTPDYEEPDVIKQLNSDLVIWTNFNNLYSAIVEITATDESWLTSPSSPPSEQERFLLRELVQMFLSAKLVNSGKSDAVLIVAARSAIEDYRNFSVYVCQPNRSFQRVEYIGFYHSGAIDKRIARIVSEPVEEIDLYEEAIEATNDLTPAVKQSLLQLVQQLKSRQSFRYGGKYKVFFLSSPDSSDTINLAQNIKNDLKNTAGRTYAFTQGQRYVPLSALRKNPATTTQLLKEPST